jgi:hypothetical protein
LHRDPGRSHRAWRKLAVDLFDPLEVQLEALAPYRTPKGYRLENEYHYLIASAG